MTEEQMRRSRYGDVRGKSDDELALLFSFYRFVEMEKWTDDFADRFKRYSNKATAFDPALCRFFQRTLTYYTHMKVATAHQEEVLRQKKATAAAAALLAPRAARAAPAAATASAPANTAQLTTAAAANSSPAASLALPSEPLRMPDATVSYSPSADQRYSDLLDSPSSPMVHDSPSSPALLHIDDDSDIEILDDVLPANSHVDTVAEQSLVVDAPSSRGDLAVESVNLSDSGIVLEESDEKGKEGVDSMLDIVESIGDDEEGEKEETRVATIQAVAQEDILSFEAAAAAPCVEPAAEPAAAKLAAASAADEEPDRAEQPAAAAAASPVVAAAHSSDDRESRESSICIVRRVVPRVPPVVKCKIEPRTADEESPQPAPSGVEAPGAPVVPTASSVDNGRASRESSLCVVRRVLPRVPPVVKCKVEVQPAEEADSEPSFAAASEAATSAAKPQLPATAKVKKELVEPSVVHAVEKKPAAAVAAVAAPSEQHTAVAPRMNMMNDFIDSINQQIIHVNSIKEMAGYKLGKLRSPLTTVCCESGPMSIDFLNAECARVMNEVMNVQIGLERIKVTADSYLFVNIDNVRKEMNRIRQSANSRFHKGTVPKLIGKKPVKAKLGPAIKSRASSKSTSISTKAARSSTTSKASISKSSSSVAPSSSRSKEAPAKLSKRVEKRPHPDANRSSEDNKVRVSPTKRRKIDRSAPSNKRAVDQEEAGPSTSRATVRRTDPADRLSKRCAFCDRDDHEPINCHVYRSYEERQAIRVKKHMCFNCLGPFHPVLCMKPEHKTECPHCRKHSSHPAFCRFLHLPPVYRPDSPNNRSKTDKTRRARKD